MAGEGVVEEGVIKVTQIGVIGTKAGVVDEVPVEEDTVVGGIIFWIFVTKTCTNQKYEMSKEIRGYRVNPIYSLS